MHECMNECTNECTNENDRPSFFFSFSLFASRSLSSLSLFRSPSRCSAFTATSAPLAQNRSPSCAPPVATSPPTSGSSDRCVGIWGTRSCPCLLPPAAAGRRRQQKLARHRRHLEGYLRQRLRRRRRLLVGPNLTAALLLLLLVELATRA